MYYEHGIHDPHARSLLVDALKIGVVHVRGLGVSTAHYERDTRQECGYGLAAHHHHHGLAAHLRRLGAEAACRGHVQHPAATAAAARPRGYRTYRKLARWLARTIKRLFSTLYVLL